MLRTSQRETGCELEKMRADGGQAGGLMKSESVVMSEVSLEDIVFVKGQSLKIAG